QVGRVDEAEKVLGAAVSGGQARSDTAYYLARVFQARGKAAEARKVLRAALDAKGPFANRKAAPALLDKLPAAAGEGGAGGAGGAGGFLLLVRNREDVIGAGSVSDGWSVADASGSDNGALALTLSTRPRLAGTF